MNANESDPHCNKQYVSGKRWTCSHEKHCATYLVREPNDSVLRAIEVEMVAETGVVACEADVYRARRVVAIQDSPSCDLGQVRNARLRSNLRRHTTYSVIHERPADVTRWNALTIRRAPDPVSVEISHRHSPLWHGSFEWIAAHVTRGKRDTAKME